MNGEFIGKGWKYCEGHTTAREYLSPQGLDHCHPLETIIATYPSMDLATHDYPWEDQYLSSAQTQLLQPWHPSHLGLTRGESLTRL